MFLVVKTKNTPSSLKGYLRRFLSEPSTNLYIGKVTRRVAESIWDFICDVADSIEQENSGDPPKDTPLPVGDEVVSEEQTSSKFRATWILENSIEEQGYEIREKGGKIVLVDFDGFTLPKKISRRKRR